MEFIIRQTNSSDIDKILELHRKCFDHGDHWYKYMMQQFIDESYCIEYNNYIVGVLLHGTIIPCTIQDKLVPFTFTGREFVKHNKDKQANYGITMICVDPNYRRKGLATKLIEHYHNNILNTYDTICLFVRQSNISAQKLYEKMGYTSIGYVVDKYYFPIENGLFYIRYNKE